MNVLLLHKGGIGDVVFALPLLRDLKRGLPAAHLTVLTHDEGAQALQFCPDVDRVVSFGPMGQGWSPSAGLRALATAGRFDLALSSARSLRAAWLLFQLGARQRVGFAGGPERALYTHVAPWEPREVNFARRFQRVAAAAGARAAVELPARLVVSPAQQQRAREGLLALGWDGRRPLWAVHAGGGWPTKQWPTSHLAELARLAGQQHGATVLLQGGPKDSARAREVTAASNGWALDTTGDTIAEAIARASLCSAAVGIDSGLSHAAAACGVPTVFLFGPNEPASIDVAPGQALLTCELPCRPCNRRGKTGCPEGHHRCMKDHAPAAVLAALEACLASAARPARAAQG